MKQIIQNLKNGKTLLENVPCPEVRKGAVLIKTTRSLVSLGTERMLVDFSKANLIQKTRQQPDKVKQVLAKIKTEGLLPTIETVFNQLDQAIPLGYCNVGRVVAVGEEVDGFKIGDRVVSNGHHAEFVCVPQNLVASIPDNVSDEEATFAVIGAIGLQSIRLLQPTFGETIVVMGLGLIGLITAELLRANGCRVIGFDFDPQRIAIAQEKGILAFDLGQEADPIKIAQGYTKGVGVDGVIITASNRTDEIIHQVAQMCRKRGRIILVGVIGLDIQRADFYEKELSFQVSCSYGPGRYDEQYEQRGIDYPIPYVRWTEKRNFEAILQALSQGQLSVKPLITEIVDLENYQEIYENISASKSIASILKYSEVVDNKQSIQIHEQPFKPNAGVIGIIGAGNFTKMTMLPALRALDAQIKYIASANGLSGTALAKKYKIAYSTTNYQEILEDKGVDLVMITTRHNEHARMVIDALKANKNVFVEKPLAIDQQELNAIVIAQRESKKAVSVGFNRRFSPHAQKIKVLLGNAQMNVVATVNAGFVPADSWVHDLKIGGGRIVGEACHFIDLITFLTGSRVKAVCMNAMGENPQENTDNASVLLRYENGSNAVINYFSNGNKSYSKERIEVYLQEKVLILDNFRKLEGFGFKKFSSFKTSLNKGHRKQFELLLQRNGDALIPFDELVNTTQAALAAIESMKQNKWIEL